MMENIQEKLAAFGAPERKRWLACHYGISWKQYIELLVRQGFKCAICGQELEPGEAHVDHAHEPEDERKARAKGRIIRGVLCRRCNRALGLLKDSKEILLAAVNYLDNNVGIIGDYERAEPKYNKAEILTRYEAGESILDIARSYGDRTAYQIIWAIIKKSGIPLRTDKYFVTTEQKDLVERLHNSGVPKVTILAEANVSNTSYYRIIKERGLAVRFTKTWETRRREEK